MRLLLRLSKLATKVGTDHGTVRAAENGGSILPSTKRRIFDTLKTALKGARKKGARKLALNANGEEHNERMPTGREIRERRIRAGLSLSEFSRRVGISDVGLRLIEREKSQPRPKTLRAIEKVLARAEARPNSGPRSRLYPKASRAHFERSLRYVKRGKLRPAAKNSVPDSPDVIALAKMIKRVRRSEPNRTLIDIATEYAHDNKRRAQTLLRLLRLYPHLLERG
jgi:transcriptional regulator with XRE-family HTH domain